MGAALVSWNVSCSLLVKVRIDNVILPFSLCSMSRPIKSLGLQNLASKCCFNLFCISSTIGCLPEIKASST